MAAPAPLNETLITSASALGIAGAAKQTEQVNKCPTCGHLNRVGVMVCENCGTTLIVGELSVIGTKQFQKKQEEGQAPAPEPDAVAVNSAGAERFESTMVLRLEVEGGATPILVYPKTETTLGRRDPATGSAPDVDFTAYAAYRLGVSRQHAILQLKENRLDVYDLGSSNGTSINGLKLAPRQPHPLRDGDQLALGRMYMRVIFQQNKR